MRGMADVLRPHVATVAGSAVVDVVPLADGGYAVLSDRISILDAALAKRAEICGESGGGSLVVLPGEQRFLVYSPSGGWLYEGHIGGTFAKVDTDGLTYRVAPTERGYIAMGWKQGIVDVDGVKTPLAIEGRIDHAGCAWRGGAVVAGNDGIAILGPDGTVLAQGDASARHKPVALAELIAVPAYDDIALFDGDAQVVGRIPRKVGDGDLVPCGTGALTIVYDEERRETELAYWKGSEPKWSRTLAGHTKPPVVIGEYVVVVSYDTDAWILDRTTGADLANVATSYVDEVAGFADGLAFAARDQADVLWWRRDQEIVRLPHDAQAESAWQVPAGLVTHEGNILYLWRTDAQGPEWTPVSSTIPVNTPIVVGGTPLRIVAPGRFALRAESIERRQAIRIAPDAKWRPLVTRDEATRIMERLVSRSFDGPLPASDAPLEQLPPTQTVDLHGKALFAASTLDKATREKSMFVRSAFFDELGLVLGVSGRSLLAAVRARKMTLVPPRPVPGYEYLGSFTTSGALEVSDPCYVGRKVSPASGFSLSLKIAGHEGVWHVFVRSVDGCTAELVTVHDDGFEVYATDGVGMIGVDSGTAGVFDKKCPKRDPDAALEEGTFAALGAIARTGHGDGMYPVYTGKVKGRVAKIRIVYIGDDEEVDRTVAKVKATAAKPYSATAKFALGDTIEHVKFGSGSVIRVGSDGKIDVRFTDGTRTLVHGKK